MNGALQMNLPCLSLNLETENQFDHVQKFRRGSLQGVCVQQRARPVTDPHITTEAPSEEHGAITL